jgi:integrase
MKKEIRKYALTDTFVESIIAPKITGRSYKTKIVNGKKIKKQKQSIDRYWSDKVSNFCLQITHTGHKSWYCTYYNADNDKKWYCIGTWSKSSGIKSKLAHELAQKKMGKVYNGDDIQQEKKQKQKALNFSEFAPIYFKSLNTDNSTTPVKIRKIKNQIVPLWKNRKIRSITEDDAVDLLDRFDKKPAVYNVFKQYLGHMWKYALRKNYVNENVFKDIKGKPTKDRVGFFSEDQMKVLSKTLSERAKTSSLACEFIRLFLATGRRPNELSQYKWQNIDLVEKKIRVPANISKSKIEEEYLISDLATEILQRIKQRTGNYIYVFSKIAFNEDHNKLNNPQDVPWKTYRTDWEWIRAKAGLDQHETKVVNGKKIRKFKWVFYHWRHTFGSQLARKESRRYVKAVSEDVKDALQKSSDVLRI